MTARTMTLPPVDRSAPPDDSLVYTARLLAIVLGIALIPFRESITASNLSFAFVVLTVVVAAFGGRSAGVARRWRRPLSLDFLTWPYLSLRIQENHDLIAFAGLTVCGLVAPRSARPSASPPSASCACMRSSSTRPSGALEGAPLEPELARSARARPADPSVRALVLRAIEAAASWPRRRIQRAWSRSATGGGHGYPRRLGIARVRVAPGAVASSQGRGSRSCCTSGRWPGSTSGATALRPPPLPGAHCRTWRVSSARCWLDLPDMARARPEDFLELVERSKGGRLKVYIGSAAGVGKTYRMLHEAHGLEERGIDVVLGFIETHGRAETAALIQGLEVVPRRKIEYRGVTVEEMDVDAVLARHPQVAIVDEVANTNAPGSAHRKRFEDIEAILAAGINVICAFNVQHLESLNDLIERVTHVRVRETVPDRIVKKADQVVNLDLSVEDLIDRLKSGRSTRRTRCPRARELLHPGEAAQPARAGPARGGGVGGAGAHTADRIPQAAARERARDGVHVVLLAPRRGHAPTRIPLRGTPEHGLVRGLRGDAGRVSRPHRFRRPAPPAREHREGQGDGRRGRALEGKGPGRGAAGLRPLAQRRLHHDRPLAPPALEAYGGATS